MSLLFFIIVSTGVVAVSMASVLIKLCPAPPLVIAFYRLWFASLFFIFGSIFKKCNILTKLSRADFLWAALSGAFLCAHFATWISSLNYTSVASSVVLVSTSPVFVGFGGILFLQETPSKWLLTGGLITIAGCVVVSWFDFSSGSSSQVGNLLAITGAVAVAGYLLIGRKLRSRIDTFTYVTVVYSFTAFMLLILLFAVDLPLSGYNSRVYFLLFLIALFPQVIGHTSFNWALQHVSAGTVSVIALGEPVFAPILAYFILGEKITGIQLIGGMLILLGVLVALLGEFNADS